MRIPGKIEGKIRRVLRPYLYNAGYRLVGAIDGYPFPPSDLVFEVIGNREIAWYQLGGMFTQQAIVRLLWKNGVNVEELRSILDFGCGCGRVTRFWGLLKDRCEIWGTDLNPALVDWCRKKLVAVGQFELNGMDPPLPFPDAKFEFIYSISVLTHLTVARQKPWMRELARVLKPGGTLLVTTHGVRCVRRNQLTEIQMEALRRDNLLVLGGEQKDGSNSVGAYHTEAYMRTHEDLGLKLVDFQEAGLGDPAEQDVYIYQKL